MKIYDGLFRRSQQQPSSGRGRRIAEGLGIAILLAATGIAVAQNPADQIPAPETNMSVPAGYSIHSSVDVGGRLAGLSGSGSMYDTMVNLKSGPRVFGQTFEMRALPDNKHPLFDNLSAFSTGFGGEPYNFNKLDFSKGKLYEFSGMFRRDRQYFDYDLLGNPGIPSGYSTPIGTAAAPTGTYPWPQWLDSPFLFNTVRRMTDMDLTLLPLSKVTYRLGYSQNIMQGPSLTPSGNSVAGSEVLLQEYQRNSSDDFFAAIDFKPVQGTKFSYEEQIDHYRGDSYFVMDPNYLIVQEANGTKVSLLDSYQNFMPYGYNTTTGAFAPSTNCNNSAITAVLTANPSGGVPIVDPSCNVISSYFRSQPTREIFPTEIFRLQSTSIKNLSMDGDVRYTSANMNLPNYYENFQGLDKTSRELAYAGEANAQRKVMAFDYGIVWQASKTVSLSDQVSFSNVHQPGVAEFLSSTTESVPATADNINTTPTPPVIATTGSAPFEGSPAIGTPSSDYLGNKSVVNNATVSWDATPRSMFSLTYRYGTHVIAEGIPHNAAVPLTCAFSVDPACGTISINENGGILNVALRPTDNWNISGSVEALYDNNVLTPVAPRQSQHYRLHTLYRPRTWATISAAYNDLEEHNNTNNTGTAPPATVGPLDHASHSRFLGFGADLMPNEHYGLDLNYTYSDVYTATNICFQAAATPLPGGAIAPAAATPSGTLCTAYAGGSRAALIFGAKDFENAPTQFGSAAILLSPNPKFRSNVGYRINSVNGSRLFTDASDVNGTLVSTYQTPFVNAAWTVHPGLVWKIEYDFYDYGEGGRSGAQYCNNAATLAVGATSAAVVPCSSLPNTAMSGGTPLYGFTAPRNFHANNVILGMHYEF